MYASFEAARSEFISMSTSISIPIASIYVLFQGALYDGGSPKQRGLLLEILEAFSYLVGGPLECIQYIR